MSGRPVFWDTEAPPLPALWLPHSLRVADHEAGRRLVVIFIKIATVGRPDPPISRKPSVGEGTARLPTQPDKIGGFPTMQRRFGRRIVPWLPLGLALLASGATTASAQPPPDQSPF